jgi:predicted sulfurtransferase
MLSSVNIAAYKFTELEDLADLRAQLLELCRSQQIRGTILLSVEGINLFVAGSRRGIDALLAKLHSMPGLADLEVKRSFSSDQPFNRMLVKIKKEIIAFGVEEIDPRRYTSRRLAARELKRWLDEGRNVTLLDTRNNFEIQAGTFRNATAIGVDDFRDFPAAVQHLPDELKDHTVVTFCTGGIRCEKASPYLERAGFRDVYQLEGGILKYLEECGGDHYEGHCFVFDKRVAVDAALREGDLKQCYVCQAILRVEDHTSSRYVEGQSCPFCYETEADALRRRINQRQMAIRAASSPLPGSLPYHNVRPISVPLRLDGSELLDFLEAMRTQLTRAQWREVCEKSQLVCRGEVIQPGRIVWAGERLLINCPPNGNRMSTPTSLCCSKMTPLW